MKRVLIIGGILLALFLVIQWLRSDYLAFSAKRDDWHRRCDAYVGDHATLHDPDRVAACEREAAELVAYAKRKGWTE